LYLRSETTHVPIANSPSEIVRLQSVWPREQDTSVRHSIMPQRRSGMPAGYLVVCVTYSSSNTVARSRCIISLTDRRIQFLEYDGRIFDRKHIYIRNVWENSKLQSLYFRQNGRVKKAVGLEKMCRGAGAG
jgi:hypothetical protein